MNEKALVTDRDALLQTARHLRDGQRIAEALTILARLETLYPRFSRLYQERGHCHVLLGDAPSALIALQEAVRLNPTLPASWGMLEQLYLRLGQAKGAAMAARQLAALTQLPPEVVMANSLYADGDLAPAEEIIRQYLRGDDGNVGALRLLARIRDAQGATIEAEGLLENVLAQAPDYQEARLDYALILLQQQKHLQARQQAEHLLACDPANRDYLKQYGAACIGLGDYEPLIDLYQKLLENPRLPASETADLRLWRAGALKITGHQAEAIADYQAAVSARPDQGVAWFGLANLKTYRFSDEEIAHMTAGLALPGLQDMDRVYLNFALGKALEDRSDYAASWRFYSQGNAVRSQTSRYRPEISDACAGRLKSVFTPEFFAERAGWGADDPAPVFVLGLPRSGSTLIEQILASHSQIEGTQELTFIGRYAGELCGLDPDCGLPLNPEILRHLTAEDARRLGERFLADTRPYRRLGRPFFIDKMPNNFWHIGLIRLILPQATLIDVRREPMASGFSNFKQLFGTINNEFSYDLGHLGRHYRTYLDLMQHWDSVLPGQVLRVPYENVVDDLEDHVQRLLAHCSLPFEATCLSFHETKRSVRTPSSEQVRQPIYREGVEQWKHFETWLGPLKNALGVALTTYRY